MGIPRCALYTTPKPSIAPQWRTCFSNVKFSLRGSYYSVLCSSRYLPGPRAGVPSTYLGYLPGLPTRRHFMHDDVTVPLTLHDPSSSAPLYSVVLILVLCFAWILNICLHPHNILTSPEPPTSLSQLSTLF